MNAFLLRNNFMFHSAKIGGWGALGQHHGGVVPEWSLGRRAEKNFRRSWAVETQPSIHGSNE